MVVYVLSIAFQIVGAIVLLFNCFGTKNEREYFERNYNGNIAWRDEPLDKEKSVRILEDIWKSRLSLIFIVIGYLTGIFSDIGNQNRIHIAVSVAVTSILLSVVLVLLSKLAALISFELKYKGKKNISV